MELSLDLFSSKKTKGIKSHISNLVAIARLDGNFSMREKRLIFEIGKRNGLSNDKLKSIIKSDNPIKFKVPKTDEDRFERVYELVEMAVVEGEEYENEIESCIEIAEKLGFRKAIVGVLVRKLATGILSKEKTKAELKAECANFLNINV